MLLRISSLLVLGLCWAGHVAFSKMIDAVTLQEIAAVMLLYLGVIAPLLMIILIVYQRGLPSFRSAGLFFTITAFFGYLTPVVVELRVMPHIPVAVFLFAGTLVPAVSLGLTGLLRLERVGWLRSLGLVTGLGSVFLLLGNPFAESSVWNIWYLVALLMPLTYGSIDLFIEYQWPKGMSQLQVAAGDSCLALVFVAMFALAVGVDQPLLVSMAEEKPLPIAGLIITSFITTILFFFIVRKFGAVFVSFAAFIALLMGIGLGAIVFAEQLPQMFYPAMGVLSVSLLLLNLGSRFRFHKNV